MPMCGVTSKTAKDLKFKWLDLRTLHTILIMIGTFIMFVVCFKWSLSKITLTEAPGLGKSYVLPSLLLLEKLIIINCIYCEQFLQFSMWKAFVCYYFFCGWHKSGLLWWFIGKKLRIHYQRIQIQNEKSVFRKWSVLWHLHLHSVVFVSHSLIPANSRLFKKKILGKTFIIIQCNFHCSATGRNNNSCDVTCSILYKFHENWIFFQRNLETSVHRW